MAQQQLVGNSAARAAVTATFLCNGVLLASFIARIPAVRADLGLREATLGLVLGGIVAGIISGLVVAGRVVGRTGSRTLTLAGAAVSVVFLPLAGFAPSAPLLAAALVVLGASTSVMDVGMNAQGVGVERGVGRSIMVGLHGAWSVGTLLGALGGAVATGIGLAVNIHLTIVAVVVAVVTTGASRWLRIDDRRTDGVRSGFAWPRGALLPLSIVVLAGALGETTASDWSGVHLDAGLGVADERVGWGYVAFTAAMTISRLVGDAVVRRIGARRAVAAGGLIAGAGFLFVAVVPTLPAALVGFFLVGVGLGGTVPLVFAAAARVADTPGAGVAAVASVGYLGALVAPPTIGAIADVTDLRVAFGIIGVAVVALTMRRPATLDQPTGADRTTAPPTPPT